MKVIIYTLNKNGSIPDYVIDGGYFPNPNGKPTPQDIDLVGMATDDAPGIELSTKADILAYCATFMDEAITSFSGNTISTANAVSEWCNEKGIG